MFICFACVSGNQRAKTKSHIFRYCKKVDIEDLGGSRLPGRNCDARQLVPLTINRCSAEGCGAFFCCSFGRGKFCYRHLTDLGFATLSATRYLLCHVDPLNREVMQKFQQKDTWRPDASQLGNKGLCLALFTRRTRRKSGTEFCTDLHVAPPLGFVMCLGDGRLGLLSLEQVMLAPAAVQKLVWAAWSGEDAWNKGTGTNSCLADAKESFGDVPLSKVTKVCLDIALETTGNQCVANVVVEGLVQTLVLPLSIVTEIKRGVFLLDQRRGTAALALAGVSVCVQHPSLAGSRLHLVRLLLGMPPLPSCPKELTLHSLLTTPLTQNLIPKKAKRLASQLADLGDEFVTAVPLHRFLSSSGGAPRMRPTPPRSSIDLLTCLDGGTVKDQMTTLQTDVEACDTFIQQKRRDILRMREEMNAVLQGDLPVAGAAQPSLYRFGVDYLATNEREGDDDSDVTDDDICPICLGPSENVALVGPGHGVELHASDRYCNQCADIVLATYTSCCPLCRKDVTGKEIVD